MSIKFAVLRTHDGQAYDLLRPGCKTKAGVGGIVEVLLVGGGKHRVTVNGTELSGHPAQWPNDLTASPAKVVIERLDNDQVADTKTAEVEITGLPDASPARENVPAL